jgi:hypothetical protein
VRAGTTRKALVVGGAAAAVLSVLVPSAAASPPSASSSTYRRSALATPAPGISANWAGYVATATPPTASDPAPAPAQFTDVTGTWTQTKATCTGRETTSSALWVGLGGVDETSQGLEQLGTEADCSAAGIATYSAWYELLPADPVKLSIRIRPGDRVTAAVLSVGPQIVLSLKDLTRHTRFGKRLPSVDPLDLGSAEWIAEAPAACSAGGRRCRIVPLTNFGTVTFSRAAAIECGHPGTISDPSWSATQVSLVPNGMRAPSGAGASNTHGASPSGLSPDGRSFSVAWQRTPAAGTP